MCIPYLFIDVSTEEYEEEGDYEEEEEEHLDNCTNQGKLMPLQAILVQASKDTIAIYLGNLTNPKFLPCKLLLLFIKVLLQLTFVWVLELLQELQA